VPPAAAYSRTVDGTFPVYVTLTQFTTVWPGLRRPAAACPAPAALVANMADPASSSVKVTVPADQLLPAPAAVAENAAVEALYVMRPLTRKPAAMPSVITGDGLLRRPGNPPLRGATVPDDGSHQPLRARLKRNLLNEVGANVAGRDDGGQQG